MKLDDIRERDGKLPAYAWPGGYPIYYLAKDNGVLCPDCANSPDCVNADPDDAQWKIVAFDVYYEGPTIHCDNCNAEIESAYGDPDSDSDD